MSGNFGLFEEIDTAGSSEACLTKAQPLALNISQESRPKSEGVNLTTEMGGYTNLTSPNGYEMRSKVGFFYRRTGIILLFAIIHYFLLTDWKNKRDSIIKSAIRGGIGMRAVGENCGIDKSSGRQKKINNRHAVVFDAGSTGSRVHIYEFQYCGDDLKSLIDEVFEEVKPGLSHYHEDPPKAASSLSPLFQTALLRIPKKNHQCTPLVVKATAGLRLLPDFTVKEVLEKVRGHIRLHSFILSNDEAVAVMDGSEEGVFAWVTVNFLQNRIRTTKYLEPGQSFLPEETSVVMDLGGGSTQIVFAVANQLRDGGGDFDVLSHPQYYYRLKLYGNEIDLYQQSYLGYGLIEARKKIKQNHISKMLSGAANDGRALRFPCHPNGFQESINFENKTFSLAGDSSGWDACLNVVSSIFDKSATCSLHPCSFNGIHQPPIKTKSLIAFSYFFDRLIPLGLVSPVTLFDIDREGRRLCKAMPGSRFGKLLEEDPQWCLDLAYIYSLLRTGYQIDIDQPIVVTKQINGYEAGWSLGAALKLLETAKACSEEDL